ncbi:ABC transporter ATP-binding protein/permease [Flavobacterium cyanobacteriorum]|uniref:ABC transporter ATP-binding protein/permease n=1 Tax=Flavobacterium cyanobacteriorum TaxID=2022802 RepID=A0A255YVE1_9FLAO|nr:ATP-binding cassette domain-containing protein [Flavobacterium cyanobacteriorum]OYQ33141.1 ABC transporter ATP-binding protein/permease [Flavobacterium cyanobacteriorum]
MTPLKRFLNLLRLDKKDVYQIIFYAAFSGLISLSLPLGIQAIINFIQSGQVSVSWIILVIVVTLGVAFVGVLSLMQLRITENLQQKIFVRSSFEFAYRLPKIKFSALYNRYPPELANRFFDTISIQKGTSKLLIDFSSALLQIGFGVILLSLYHPFFIIFGVLLVFLLYYIFKYSYTPGLSTSMNESKYKYKAAFWLQEIARNHTSFRKLLSFDYALKKNDTLVSDYICYREKHFAIIKRQFIQLIAFKVIITAGLLSIGGYLVLSQKMNIGQFVAAEIIILLVINSVEKIILGLETLYDVLTSIEKIGEVTDMALEQASASDIGKFDQVTLEADNVSYRFPDSDKDVLENITLKIHQGEKIFVSGRNGSGKTTLVRVLAGLLQPAGGGLYINDGSYSKINMDLYRAQTGVVMQGETPFEGTILENITMNNPEITADDVKWALEAVGLASHIKRLPDGLDTYLHPDGMQLSASNSQKILLARSIVNRPNILFLEDPTDKMDETTASEIINFLFSKDNSWTVIVSSVNLYWKGKCSRHIVMDKGKITEDTLL